MNEMRVCIESLPTVSEEIRSAWFTLPIDADVFEERLQVSMDSEDYRIIEKELPFANEVKEDTIYKSQDNLTNLLQLSVLNFFRIKFIFDSIRWTINIK